MTWRFLQENQGGDRTWFKYDESEDKAIIWTGGDAEKVLDANARHHLDQTTPTGEFRHIASIPTGVYYAWLTEAKSKGIPSAGPEWAKFRDAKLRDSDWRKCLLYPELDF